MYNSNEIFGKAANQIIHDIRNYLNSIIGFSSLIENDKKIEPEELDYINKIISAGLSIEKLLGFISDFINDDFDIIKENIILNNLIISIFDKLKKTLDEKKIKIIFKLENNIKIKSSKEILEKIFFNLIEFSLKGLRGSNEKSINVELFSKNKKSVVILYSDSSNPVYIKKDYFNEEEILESRRGLSLFFLKKYTDLLKGDIKYNNKKYTESNINIKEHKHEFIIELIN